MEPGSTDSSQHQPDQPAPAPNQSVEPAPVETVPVQTPPVPETLCKGCGYALTGLGREGNCPECGLSIERSLRGDLLRDNTPEYLATLYRGVVMIEASLVFMVLMMIAAIAFGVASTAITGSGPARGYDIIMGIVTLIGSVISTIGWWWFSAADLSRRSTDTGESERRIVRFTTLFMMGCTIASLVFETVGHLGSLHSGKETIYWITTAASGIAWVVHYFASMRYIRWTAPRIPSEKIHRWANMLMWLGPLLMTVGSIAACLGPVAALILYYRLFDMIRLELKAVRAQQLADQAEPQQSATTQST